MSHLFQFCSANHRKESEKSPSLKKNSFILTVQTEFQMELYQQFSNKILCTDATHSTNAYQFKLITFLVQDEFNQGGPTIFLYKIILTICKFTGQPIAWCISDQETTDVVRLFLQSINDNNKSP